MSKIDALSILGIRSFDNSHPEKIQFFTPLTLIVGYNGSGKTTIIECLKFAACGDQPPNSKIGGAFVHDPQLCGEKEVMAQVKMQFTNASDAQMIITRNLQLTVKKDNARSLKTIEGQLLINKNKERIAVSSRTAELDQMTPQYLGVSKAILDNVIFCHQDESLWPMSEPSTLKKKFDEIFEALKYTKVIDNLKVLRKKQVEEVARLKEIERHEKDNKDKGERAEQRSYQLQGEIEQLNEKATEMKKQRDQAQEQASKAYDRASRYQAILSKLEVKRSSAEAKKESIEDFKNDLEEMAESDDALRSMLDQYEQRVQTHEAEVQRKSEQYQQIEEKIKAKGRDIGQMQKELGQHANQKDAYEQQLQKREQIVKEVAQQQHIRGFDLDLDDTHIRDFMDRVAKLARDHKATLERARQESKNEISDAQASLNKSKQDLNALSQDKSYANKHIADNDGKIAEHDRTLNSLNVDDGTKTNLESNLRSLRETLQNLKSKYDAANWTQRIRHTDQEIRTLDEKRDSLDAEMEEAIRNASETAEIDLLRRNLRESEDGLKTMMGVHADRLNKIIGSPWQPPDLENKYQSVVDAKSAEIKDAQARADQLGIQLNQMNFKITTNKQETKTKFEKKEQYEKEIRDATGEQDLLEFHNTVQTYEENVNTQRRNLELGSWYQQCLDSLKQHKCCRLCQRTFAKQDEQAKFESFLRNQIEKADIKEATKDLEEAEADLREIRKAAPSFDNWRALTQTEIPTAKREGLKLEGEHKTIVAKVEEADRQVKTLESDKREIDVVAKNVKKIVEYANSINSFKDKIDVLSQKSANPAQSRGVEAIRNDQKTTNEQHKQVRKKLSDLHAEEKGAQEQIKNKGDEVQFANENLNEMTNQLKKRDEVQFQREELIKLSKTQREKISEVEAQMRKLEPEISQHEAQLDDIRDRAEEKQDRLQAEGAALDRNLEDLKAAQSEITSYIQRGGPDQLSRAEKELKAVEEELKDVEGERTETIKEINKLKQQAANQGTMKKNIERNLKYRRDVVALDELHQEIEGLKTQYEDSERTKYEMEAKEWENKRIAYSGEAQSLLGEAKSKDNELQNLLDNWNTDYKDAKRKYLEASVKLQTTKAAVEDLARYGGALDKAIMKYHSLKMDEINNVIDELWRKTYQGTDVDTILIRSDNDKSSSANKKSYNYRVCMVKQEAEMDMRGRCSAGQKVLASIIIRLALAECFGVSCGMIALDEPTTNLDRDNIRSLARALHDIIKTRQQQSNFQLIVITHDEEFLHFMQCRDFCDYYYRISRSENQKSEIRKQKLSEVM